jgi:hypothetical protein
MGRSQFTFFSFRFLHFFSRRHRPIFLKIPAYTPEILCINSYLGREYSAWREAGHALRAAGGRPEGLPAEGQRTHRGDGEDGRQDAERPCTGLAL